MDRLSKIACYFRWVRGTPSRSPHNAPAPLERNVEDENENESDGDARQSNAYNRETSKRFYSVLESILLWENSVNSISVVIVFNILFWGIIVLEIRGFAAASSAALVVVLCYSTLEAQAQKGNTSSDTLSHVKAEQIENLGRRIKSTLHNLKQLRKDQPGVFCTAVCSLSLSLWVVGHTVNGVLLAYVICMSVLLGPAILLKLPSKIIPHKEWDSEIEEFLPTVTEDNLQLLMRVGETGDHSPTPSMLSDVQNDFFNDDDIAGLKMPSHEDGSTDGVELSELELSTGDTDFDAIKFQSGHFERSSSSEEEGELQPEVKQLASHSDETDSEFEIIDTQEIANMNVT